MMCDEDPNCKSFSVWTDDGGTNQKTCITRSDTTHGKLTSQASSSYWKDGKSYDKPSTQPITSSNIHFSGTSTGLLDNHNGGYFDGAGLYNVQGHNCVGNNPNTGDPSAYFVGYPPNFNEGGSGNGGAQTCRTYFSGADMCLPGKVVSVDNIGGGSGYNKENTFKCNYESLDNKFVENNWAQLYSSGLLNSQNDADSARIVRCNNLSQSDLDGTTQVQTDLTNNTDSLINGCLNIPVSDKQQITTALLNSASHLPTWYNTTSTGMNAMNTAIRDANVPDSLKVKVTSKLNGGTFGPQQVQMINKLLNFQESDILLGAATPLVASNVLDAVNTFCSTNQSDPKCACYNAQHLGIDNCEVGIPGCDDIVPIRDGIRSNKNLNPADLVTIKSLFSGPKMRKYSTACVKAGQPATTDVLAADQLTAVQAAIEQTQLCMQAVTTGNVSASAIKVSCAPTATNTIINNKGTGSSTSSISGGGSGSGSGDSGSGSGDSGSGSGDSGSGSSASVPFYKNPIYIGLIIFLVLILFSSSGGGILLVK